MREVEARHTLEAAREVEARATDGAPDVEGGIQRQALLLRPRHAQLRGAAMDRQAGRRIKGMATVVEEVGAPTWTQSCVNRRLRAPASHTGWRS